MARQDKQTEGGALTAAAVALEAEIERFEELVSELSRVGITSDKTLQRARQMLEECASYESRLGERLRVFAEAMQRSQERQQQAMVSAVETAERIRLRHEARKGLLERVDALGRRAKEINDPIADLTDGGEGDAAQRVLGSLRELALRLESVISDAGALSSDARDAEWLDIARDADALKQQLQAARNKVLLVERNTASRAPS